MAKLFCSTLKSPPHLKYITPIESAYQKLYCQEAEELKADINRVFRSSHTPKPNLTQEELKALTELRKDSNRIVLAADKGVAIVVMDRKDYTDKATNLLSQPAYRTIHRDPTNHLKAKLITLLGKIKRKIGIGGPHLQVHVPYGMYFPQVLWSSKDP